MVKTKLLIAEDDGFFEKILQQVLGSMKGLIEINELVKQLREIEESERHQAEWFSQMRNKLENDLLEGADRSNPPPKKEEKKP